MKNTSHPPGPKKIYLNGVEVGEYIATGDVDVDTRAATQVLMDRGLYKPVSQLQAMFNQAHAFCIASATIYQAHLQSTPTSIGYAAVPFIVNAAFSAEVYLKLLKATEGSPPRGHKIISLFHSLSPTLKAELDATAARLAPSYKDKVAQPPDLRSYLSQLNEVFETWRYLYE